MSAQHTPGPWIVDAAAEVVYGTSDEGEHIVVVYELNTNEADARLIAAAPDLLEALIALHAVAVVSDEQYSAVTNAAAAIHRAVGRVS